MASTNSNSEDEMLNVHHTLYKTLSGKSHGSHVTWKDDGMDEARVSSPVIRMQPAYSRDRLNQYPSQAFDSMSAFRKWHQKSQQARYNLLEKVRHTVGNPIARMHGSSYSSSESSETESSVVIEDKDSLETEHPDAGIIPTYAFVRRMSLAIDRVRLSPSIRRGSIEEAAATINVHDTDSIRMASETLAERCLYCFSKISECDCGEAKADRRTTLKSVNLKTDYGDNAFAKKNATPSLLSRVETMSMNKEVLDIDPYLPPSAMLNDIPDLPLSPISSAGSEMKEDPLEKIWDGTTYQSLRIRNKISEEKQTKHRKNVDEKNILPPLPSPFMSPSKRAKFELARLVAQQNMSFLPPMPRPWMVANYNSQVDR